MLSPPEAVELGTADFYSEVEENRREGHDMLPEHWRRLDDREKRLALDREMSSPPLGDPDAACIPPSWTRFWMMCLGMSIGEDD